MLRFDAAIDFVGERDQWYSFQDFFDVWLDHFLDGDYESDDQDVPLLGMGSRQYP